MGLTFLSDDPRFILGFGIVGSIILIGFGIAIYASPLRRPDNSEITMSNAIQYFFKGVTINVFNPVVLLIWVGILSAVSEETFKTQWIFVAAMLSVVALGDIFKSLFASKLISKLDNSKLLIFKNASGIIISIIGIAMLVRAILKVVQ